MNIRVPRVVSEARPGHLPPGTMCTGAVRTRGGATMNVRHGLITAGAGLAGLSVMVMAVSVGYGMKDALGPGAGFFSFWLSLIGGLLSVGLLASAWRGTAPGELGASLFPKGDAARRCVAMLAAVVLAALLIEPLGYRLTAAALVAGLLYALEARGHVAIWLFAAAASFGVYHVFMNWLLVPLPGGALGF
ncbi:MAG: tripartite tricarboxylate transporter TctB family protein [Betaproteobacteria bacterium]|nr:tripartite tricarboxylate transporter TctB family protein [Betaproteobacteria bacterium]